MYNTTLNSLISLLWEVLQLQARNLKTKGLFDLIFLLRNLKNSSKTSQTTILIKKHGMNLKYAWKEKHIVNFPEKTISS